MADGRRTTPSVVARYITPIRSVLGLQIDRGDLQMPSLGELNKSVSLSSASHDFVLLAKSLAAARGDISETQDLARTAPSMRVREVLSDLKAAVDADVVVERLGVGTVRANGCRVFR